MIHKWTEWFHQITGQVQGIVYILHREDLSGTDRLRIDE